MPRYKTTIRAALAAGELDIIITHESDTLHHQHFEYSRLGHYQEVLVCHPLHSLSQLSTINASDLSLHRELIWGEIGSENNSNSAQNSDGYSPSYGVFSDIQLLITMLKHNKGYAFLPADTVTHDIKTGQLITINCDFEPTSISRRIELCWRNGITLSEHGKTVIDAFKAQHQLTEH